MGERDGKDGSPSCPPLAVMHHDYYHQKVLTQQLN